MKAGDLNERIEIYENKSLKDDYGSTKQQWTKVCGCWAKCRFKLGTLKEIAGELVNSSANSFTIRHHYSNLINERMRIYYNGRKYAIKSLNKNKMNDTLIIEGESINE